MSRRAFVVVLDACGVGELPDSAEYGDAGANTLAHFAELAGGFDLPVLQSLGLGSIVPLEGVAPAGEPVLHGRLHPLGPGKDTTAGHWELMGCVAPAAPTFPEGFPVERLRRALGTDILGNRPANGITVLDELGAEHLRTGLPIVYTSADSVLQLAAHADAMELEELYAACLALREEFSEVGRVIARPFSGTPGAWVRMPGRRDFAQPPAYPTYLDAITPVHAVGKVGDVFAGVGVDATHTGATNVGALDSIGALIDGLEGGLVFANLVDTDQIYGHRKDVEGFHHALQEIDAAVGLWLTRLDPQRDLLILTADHGVDPCSAGTDHTREHVPLLAAFAGHGGRRHDGPMADVGATVCAWLGSAPPPGAPGRSFL